MVSWWASTATWTTSPFSTTSYSGNLPFRVVDTGTVRYWNFHPICGLKALIKNWIFFAIGAKALFPPTLYRTGIFRDVENLPQALSDALRQWFELVCSNSWRVDSIQHKRSRFQSKIPHRVVDLYPTLKKESFSREKSTSIQHRQLNFHGLCRLLCNMKRPTWRFLSNIEESSSSW